MPKLWAAGETVLVDLPGPYGEVVFLDATDGEETQRFGPARVVAVASPGPTVVLGATMPSRGLIGFDGAGERVWQRDTSVDGRCCARPRPGDRHVLLALDGRDRYYEVVDGADGQSRLRGRLDLGNHPIAYSEPRTVLSRQPDQEASMAIDLATGQELWRVTASRPHLDVVEDLALVPLWGELVALELPGSDGPHR